MPTTYITFDEEEEDDAARIALHSKLLSDNIVLNPTPVDIKLTPLQIIIIYASDKSITMFEMKKNMNRSWETQMKPLLPDNIEIKAVEFIDN